MPTTPQGTTSPPSGYGQGFARSPIQGPDLADKKYAGLKAQIRAAVIAHHKQRAVKARPTGHEGTPIEGD